MASLMARQIAARDDRVDPDSDDDGLTDGDEVNATGPIRSIPTRTTTG